MIWSLGTDGHEPSGTRVAPTAENSSSSKIRSGLRSTLTLKPASTKALVVVGVTREGEFNVDPGRREQSLTSRSVLQKLVL